MFLHFAFSLSTCFPYSYIYSCPYISYMFKPLLIMSIKSLYTDMPTWVISFIIWQISENLHIQTALLIIFQNLALSQSSRGPSLRVELFFMLFCLSTFSITKSYLLISKYVTNQPLLCSSIKMAPVQATFHSFLNYSRSFLIAPLHSFSACLLIFHWAIKMVLSSVIRSCFFQAWNSSVAFHYSFIKFRHLKSGRAHSRHTEIFIWMNGTQGPQWLLSTAGALLEVVFCPLSLSSSSLFFHFPSGSRNVPSSCLGQERCSHTSPVPGRPLPCSQGPLFLVIQDIVERCYLLCKAFSKHLA